MKRKTKSKIAFSLILVISVVLALILGYSQEAGLFGAIFAGGLYIIDLLHEMAGSGE